MKNSYQTVLLACMLLNCFAVWNSPIFYFWWLIGKYESWINQALEADISASSKQNFYYKVKASFCMYLVHVNVSGRPSKQIKEFMCFC